MGVFFHLIVGFLQVYQQIEHEIQRLFRIAIFHSFTEDHRPQVGTRCPWVIDFECFYLVGNDDGAALALAVHLGTHADAAVLAALHIDVAAVDLYAVAGVAAVIAHTDAREVPSAVGSHGAAVDGDGLAATVVAGADARAMLVTPSICISKFFPASYPYTNTLSAIVFHILAGFPSIPIQTPNVALRH